MRFRLTIMFLVVFACHGLSPAAAQEPSHLPPVGARGIYLAFPDGGSTTLGLRKMTASDRSVGLGLILGVSWNRQDRSGAPAASSTNWTIGITPDVRKYRDMGGPVVPFVQFRGQLLYHHSPNAHQENADAGLGLGAEWSPLQRMSFSAFTGVDLLYSHSSDTGGSAQGLSLQTLTSGLTLNFYFGGGQ